MKAHRQVGNRRWRVGSPNMNELVIDKPAKLLGLPFDCVAMKVK